MNTNYEKVKADLLAFGKKNGACVEQYQRLYKAESIEEVIAVVKDNFWWCAKYRDFADVIMANREQFAEHQIWANQDVEIREGVGYLLATEGKINATSSGTSTIYATSSGTSTIYAKSWETSTIYAKSWETSTIYAESWESSTIYATSSGTSTIYAKSWETSTIYAKSWESSTIYAKSYDTSTINAESWESSTIYAKSYDTSTMIIRSSNVECQVKDRSIARYVYENRIVVADDSIKVEKAKE